MKYFAFLWRMSRNLLFQSLLGFRAGGILTAAMVFLTLLILPFAFFIQWSGIGFERVDLWLDAHNGWFEIVGIVLLKALFGFGLLASAVLVGSMLFEWISPLFGKRMEVGADGKLAGRATQRASPAPRSAEEYRAQQVVARKADEERPGCFTFGLFLVIGYFSWIGLVNPI